MAQSNLTQAEYFFDTDPGMGAALPIAGFSASSSIDVNDMIDVSTLTIGMHTLGIRVMDDNLVWSMAEYIPVFVTLTSANIVANLTTAEYFFDTDPGMGAATSITLTASQNIDINDLFPTSALSLGMHTLNIRLRNEFNEWSMVESISIFVTKASAILVEDIDQVEYFFDTDPGIGLATPLIIPTAQNIDINELIPTGALSTGMHILNIRIRTTNGEWSLAESVPIYLDQDNLITQLEHFVDTDPGVGSATNIAITPPANNLDLDLSVPTSSLGIGSHTLNVRIGSAASWGLTETITFNLCAGAIPDFTVPNNCIGDATIFTDISSNVLVGDVYSWDFDGDGFEDSNTSGNQSFTYSSIGLKMATLTINRAGCIGTLATPILIEPIATANAGIDQAICTTVTTLAGNALSANETGTWLLTKGTATITNANDPLSTLTSITSDSIELSWTVTNSIAGCSSVDSVLISSNQPIIAVAANGNVDIGQSINFDVQSLANTNLGDILTTTIITPSQNGVYSIGTNGSISYTPYPDAPATDFLVYRITNQCNNFGENQIDFNISNAPPVINSTGIVTTSGSLEITIDLIDLISDPNNNIDYNTITIISQPVSGATANIDASGVLTIDYAGITFTGTDQLEVQVCDLVGACAIEAISILNVEVGGTNPPIKVFNAVSPNGDGFHDFLEIENIEFYPNNIVIILNRWGAEISRYQGYNNKDIIFNDANLPTGIYFYHILPAEEGSSPVTGHFVLKID